MKDGFNWSESECACRVVTKSEVWSVANKKQRQAKNKDQIQKLEAPTIRSGRLLIPNPCNLRNLRINKYNYLFYIVRVCLCASVAKKNLNFKI